MKKTFLGKVFALSSIFSMLVAPSVYSSASDSVQITLSIVAEEALTITSNKNIMLGTMFSKTDAVPMIDDIQFCYHNSDPSQPDMKLQINQLMGVGSLGLYPMTGASYLPLKFTFGGNILSNDGDTSIVSLNNDMTNKNCMGLSNNAVTVSFLDGVMTFEDAFVNSLDAVTGQYFNTFKFTAVAE